MQNNLLKRSSILMQLAMVLGIGLILGIASVSMPPYFLFVGIGGVIYLVVAWLWPEIALLGILLLTSTIFDMYAYPSIPIGVGNIIISDILVFVLIGIIFLRVRTESISFLNRTPLDIPILAFYGTAILATIIGIYNSRVSFNESLGEIRVVNFYLTFFIVTNLVRSEKQLHRLYYGIVYLAVIVSIAMIAQYSLGDAVEILPGRAETLNTGGITSYGVTRVLPPGQSLVLISFVCLVVQLLFKKFSFRFFIYFIQVGIVGLAVLMTFNRSFWTGIGLALLVVSILVSLRDKVKYAEIITLAVLMSVIVLAPFLTIKGGEAEKFFDGVMLRMFTIFDPATSKESSIQYRSIENDYAYIQIASHPLFGLGLGAEYRPEDSRIASTEAGYIHNGHLWVMLKTGLIGYTFFIWIFLSFINRTFQNWRYIPDVFSKGIVLSLGAIVFGMLFISFVNPIFRNVFWAPLIGVVLGISEVIMGRTLTKLDTNIRKK